MFLTPEHYNSNKIILQEERVRLLTITACISMMAHISGRRSAGIPDTLHFSTCIADSTLNTSAAPDSDSQGIVAQAVS